jgi:hypothetical protein
MTAPPRLHRAQVFTLLLFSALAFALAFGLAYRQDKIRVAETGQLAWFHFLYAEELKDDMAVIDWSKNTGNLSGLRAFQVKVNSKVVAEGGNRDFLTDPTMEGVLYHFPSGWTYHAISRSYPQDIKEFILEMNTWPGPLLWGLLFLAASFLSGCLLALQTKNSKSPPSIKVPAPASRNEWAGPSLAGSSAVPAPDKNLTKGEPFLLIDHNYVIKQVSAGAAELLGENLDALMDRHLLDLMPDPLFIQAIEKAEEIKLSNPFPARPHLSVFLKPHNHGCLVFLEGLRESKSP